MLRNAFYAQSGGVTAVINATALGVIEAVLARPQQIGTLYAGLNGILGALHEELIDVRQESPSALQGLHHTPGGAFGSCRYKLKSLTEHRKEYERLIEVFAAHNIGYFFYNGGGDSQDTAHKVSQLGQELGYPICAIGIPKTVDNDLNITDNCPGFGSVAKYVAISTLEASLDVASMAKTSTKVFILEVMGRHTGWIAAASALAKTHPDAPPHIILLPERHLNKEHFLATVKSTVEQKGYCVIVASEGVKNSDGKFLAEAGGKDAFGHTQLGGVAPTLAQWIKTELSLKPHWALADYLQRSARHIASRVDVEQAYALGKEAVRLALSGLNAVMPTIVRESNNPYRWSLGHAPLEQVANIEKGLPDAYIRADGYGITEAGIQYLAPLIQGEAYPPYGENGMPLYTNLKRALVKKKLPGF